jgi:hypothetical protein
MPPSRRCWPVATTGASCSADAIDRSSADGCPARTRRSVAPILPAPVGRPPESRPKCGNRTGSGLGPVYPGDAHSQVHRRLEIQLGIGESLRCDPRGVLLSRLDQLPCLLVPFGPVAAGRLARHLRSDKLLTPAASQQPGGQPADRKHPPEQEIVTGLPEQDAASHDQRDDGRRNQ